MITKEMFNLKSVISVALALFILSLLGTVWYLKNENQKLNVKVSDQSINLKSLGMQTIAYVDENGHLHAESIQKVKTISELKNAVDSSSQAYRDMVKQYELKLKDITQTGQVITETKYVTKTKYVERDTTYDLSARPYIVNEVTIKKDSLYSNLEIYNKQNLFWFTKRETIDPPKKFFLFRWFQKKHDVTHVNIVNDNPYIKTTNQDFTIITK